MRVRIEAPMATIDLAGIIDGGAEAALDAAYVTCDEAGAGRIGLDFTKVDYINSSGIALVIQMLMEANKSSQKIAAFGLTPHFQKVFTMVGITKYASLYPDEAAARSSL